MRIDDVLGSMKERAFSDVFHKQLESLYTEQIKRDGVSIEEDYNQAIQELPNLLNHSQMELIHELEAVLQPNRIYAGEYGFKAGVYAAFLQLLSPREQELDLFNRFVVRELFDKENMERHTEYNVRNIRYREITDKLYENATELLTEHIASVDSTWGERIYNAAYQGFYSGYRAGWSIIDDIRFLESAHRMRDILMTEYELGLVQPYAYTEERRSREESSSKTA